MRFRVCQRDYVELSLFSYEHGDVVVRLCVIKNNSPQILYIAYSIMFIQHNAHGEILGYGFMFLKFLVRFPLAF